MAKFIDAEQYSELRKEVPILVAVLQSTGTGFHVEPHIEYPETEMLDGFSEGALKMLPPGDVETDLDNKLREQAIASEVAFIFKKEVQAT